MRTRSNVYTLIKNENTDCPAALVASRPRAGRSIRMNTRLA
jgi:hypothetical protein